ncbi:MAG: preprotein translocase subunit YajC [Myxococcota bacterium]|jgi:preprotein translocase subunit YajC|nr:preprotein translocase subunit YajC [Myxococcota bacterium]
MTLYPTLPLQAASAQGGSIPFFIPMILIGLIFYFLVIRPQNRSQKEHDEALKTAGKGDLVVTRGGLHGKVASVDDDTFVIEVGTLKGSPIKLTVEKKSVDRLTKAGTSDAKTDSKKGGDAS